MNPSGVGQLLGRVEKTLSSIGLVVACVALLASLVMVVIGVVGRYVLRVGVIFVDEYVGYGLVIMAFMALSSTLTAGKHIRIDTVVSRLPQKVQAWLEAVTAAIGLGISVLVTLQSLQRVIMSIRGGETSVSPLETPLYVPQLFIPVGFALLSFTLVVYVIGKFRIALQK